MPLTDRVKFLQKAAVMHDGQVLILKRSEDADYRPGAWDLPGGNVEWPTTDQSASNLHLMEMVRELQEEIGFSFAPGTFADENLAYFSTYFEADIPRYALIFGYRVRTDEDFNPDDLTLSDEHTEMAWITADELDDYDFGEPVGTFIKTIIRNAFKRK